MASKRKPNRKPPGMYWFPKDWLESSDVMRCSYAAQGLWFFLLNHMVHLEPAGVMPGDLAQVALIVGKGSTMAVQRAWAKENKPLFQELERNGVFSRGKDMPGALSADSIVNRKMYRKWLLSKQRSDAARSRWSKTGKTREARTDVGVCKPLSKTPCKTPCKTRAKGSTATRAKHDAKRHDSSLETPRGFDDASDANGVRDGMQIAMPSLTLAPPLPLTKPLAHKSGDLGDQRSIPKPARATPPTTQIPIPTRPRSPSPGSREACQSPVPLRDIVPITCFRTRASSQRRLCA